MSAASPRKLLDLPDDPQTTAFRSVEMILREDPTLDDVVKNWRSREGYEGDLRVPTPEACPLIALSPFPSPDGKASSDSALVQMSILVETWTEGSCVDDQINLWGAVRRAMVLSKPFRGGTVFEFLRCKLEGVSIPDLFVVKPAFTAWTPSAGKAKGAGLAGCSHGVGLIQFSFQRKR